MSENKTINPATIPRPVFAPAEGLGKIEGQEITITGFSHNRGKPNESTDKSKIGADGLTDYYTIETKEVFDLEHKQEGVVAINHFYSTPHIHNKLTSWAGSTDLAGASIGPVKARKLKKKDNAKETYWTLVTEADESY